MTWADQQKSTVQPWLKIADPSLSDCGDQVLDLTSNSLQGHVPESLGGMTDLRELWLGCVILRQYLLNCVWFVQVSFSIICRFGFVGVSE